MDLYVEPVLPAPRLLRVRRLARRAHARAHRPGDGLSRRRRRSRARTPRLPATPSGSGRSCRRTPAARRLRARRDDGRAGPRGDRSGGSGSQPAYLGVIASRKRFAELREALAARGVRARALDGIAAPAGLDIGARAPEEIALSVMAADRGAPAARRASDAEQRAQLADTARLPASEAIDPVCGMTVAIAGARHTAEVAGRTLLLLLRRLPRRSSSPTRRAIAAAGGGAMNDEIRALQAAMERHGYIAEPAIATAVYLATRDAQAAARRGRGRRRQDRDREGARPRARHRADPAAVLRGARRQHRALRVELPAPAAAPADRRAAKGTTPRQLEDLIFGREYLLERPLLRAITRRDGPPVLLDRRDRPRRRRLRGVPARGAVGLPGHDPRARDDPGGARAASSCSPRTGPARSATRCAAAACISTSSIRASRRSCASCAARCPARASSSPRRSRASCSALRQRDLRKLPGVAETIDWAQALVRLHRDRLDAEIVGADAGLPAEGRARHPGDRRSGGRGARRRRRESARAMSRGPRRRSSRRSPARCARTASASGSATRSTPATALTLVDLLDRDEVRRGAAHRASRSPRDAWATFEELFDAHLGRRRRAASAPVAPPAVAARASPAHCSGAGTARACASTRRSAERAPRATSRATAPRRCCAASPSTSCTARELAALERLLARLALAARHPAQPAPRPDAGARPRGPAPQLPATRSRTDGRVLSAWRAAPAPSRSRASCVLCDTSGSMDRLHPLPAGVRVRAAARHPAGGDLRVQHVAHPRDPPGATPAKIAATLERLAASVPDWSGGTRIGECLAAFVDALPRRDGRPRHDRRDRERRPRPRRHRARSPRAMRALRDRAGRGRLAESARSAIRATSRRPRGMRAALPFVDVFAPAHNLESLEKLLPAARPPR